ncbi:class I SAM-dependent methyltransferase [Longivirga aurantiaca]|uniref:Class I SAM-dependent methyltransferase n=1 Tax=Longivirga aurantiaca TaxID=1837743 RepID=A0ABW1T2X4_9ACTN
MAEPTRWATETPDEHSAQYVATFRAYAAEGRDISGEARLLDALVPPGSRVLDAGCGTGRVGAELHRRGHEVVGVDADPVLVAAAREDHAGPAWHVADLTELDLAAEGHTEPFHGAVVAGNVMVFVAPGTEGAVLERLAAHLVDDGPAVLGFATGRGYEPDHLADDAATAGFDVEHLFSTWDLRPWRDDADFVVAVLRRRSRS